MRFPLFSVTIASFCTSISGYLSLMTGTCFKVYSSDMTWDEAFDYCQAQVEPGIRGRLGHIPSDAIDDDLKTNPSTGPVLSVQKDLWLGLQILPEGCGDDTNWVMCSGWVDVDNPLQISSCLNSSMSDRINWLVGSTMHCLKMKRNQQWELKWCTGDYRPLCEFVEGTIICLPYCLLYNQF